MGYGVGEGAKGKAERGQQGSAVKVMGKGEGEEGEWERGAESVGE